MKFVNNFSSYRSEEVQIIELEKNAFRSFFEAQIYEVLSKYFEVWFEPYLLKHKDKMYVPDFYLPEKGVFIETKGGEMSRYSKISYFSKFVPLFLINKDFAERMKWI